MVQPKLTTSILSYDSILSIKVYLSTRMDQNTKAVGSMISGMGTASTALQTVTRTRETGMNIRSMDMEYILMRQQERVTVECGKLVRKKDLVKLFMLIINLVVSVFI